MNRRLLFLCLYICCSGCMNQKASQDETHFFPDVNHTNWWLVNSVYQDDQGDYFHLCHLLMLENTDTTNHAHFFSSLSSPSLGLYYWGEKSASGIKIARKKKFPVAFVLPGDSADIDWKWILSRRSSWIQTQLDTGSESGWSGQYIYSEKFIPRNPFSITPFNSNPQVFVMEPLVTQMSDKKVSDIGTLNARVIPDGEMLLDKAAVGCIGWIDLQYKDYQVNLLFSVDTAGTVFPQGFSVFSEGQSSNLPTIQVSIQKDKYWTSTSTSKTYPLGYYLKIPEFGIDVRIDPALENQEVNMKKSSFWMGGIIGVDASGGEMDGRGNMYIFGP